MTKAELIARAKAIRHGLDAPLQALKDFRKEALAAINANPDLAKELENSSEVIAQATLSQRDGENAIMRLGMVLKNIGNPNPYGESKLTVESLAQKCYEAYYVSTGGVSAVTGNPLPTWEKLCLLAESEPSMGKVKAGWLAVASTHPALLYVAPTADGLKL